MTDIIHIELAGPLVKLKAGKSFHTFEMHRYCGPMRCYANGEPMNRHWPENSEFWPVFEKWMEQGQRVDEHGRGIVE